MPLSATRTETVLNLGSGFDNLDDALNIDLQAFHGPDVLADVRQVPIASASADLILANDILEHLTRDDTRTLLAEWRRLLKPSGRLMVKSPDLRGLARMTLTGTQDDASGDPVDVASLYYGTQAYTGDFHLSGFTDHTLCKLALAEGLAARTIAQVDGWMLLAELVPSSEHWMAVSLTDGFHAREEADGHDFWWAGSDATLRLINPTDERLAASVRFGLTSHSGQVAEVCVWRGCELVGRGTTKPHARTLIELALSDLAPGVTSLRLTSTAADIDDAADPRELRFGLWDPMVELDDGRASRPAPPRLVVGSAPAAGTPGVDYLQLDHPDPQVLLDALAALPPAAYPGGVACDVLPDVPQRLIGGFLEQFSRVVPPGASITVNPGEDAGLDRAWLESLLAGHGIDPTQVGADAPGVHLVLERRADDRRSGKAIIAEVVQTSRSVASRVVQRGKRALPGGR